MSWVLSMDPTFAKYLKTFYLKEALVVCWTNYDLSRIHTYSQIVEVWGSTNLMYLLSHSTIYIYDTYVHLSDFVYKEQLLHFMCYVRMLVKYISINKINITSRLTSKCSSISIFLFEVSSKSCSTVKISAKRMTETHY